LSQGPGIPQAPPPQHPPEGIGDRPPDDCGTEGENTENFWSNCLL